MTSQPDKTYDLFLSYNSKDLDYVEQIRTKLREQGIKTFFDRDNFTKGDTWRSQLEELIPLVRAALVLVGEHGYGTVQAAERDLLLTRAESEKAQGRFFPVIPVILPDGPKTLSGFLQSYTWVDMSQGIHEEKIDEIIKDILSPNVAADPLQYLIKFYESCIEKWKDINLDESFINLTLSIARNDEEAEQKQAESRPYNNLMTLLTQNAEYPIMVMLGEPGAGKSTLLRHLQFSQSNQQLDRAKKSEPKTPINFYLALNQYDGKMTPEDWLKKQWKEYYPTMPSLDEFIKEGRLLLLLDALNEIQVSSETTIEKLQTGWRDYAHKIADKNKANRIVFTCRRADYVHTDLSSQTLPVPQVNVLQLKPEQIKEFTEKYAPEQHPLIWESLKESPQLLEFYNTPIYLKMLCEIVTSKRAMPIGRASLFTAFVRKTLREERKKDNVLLKHRDLLTESDTQQLVSREWENDFDLPQSGLLINKLSELAHKMQLMPEVSDAQSNGSKNQVSVPFDEAKSFINHVLAEDIIKAGVALKLLDRQTTRIQFHHQLLQEYFAARMLAKQPDPQLVHAEWEVGKVGEPLQQTLKRLQKNASLPGLPRTGWEQTTLIAAPIANNPEQFIRALMPHNLPLAAECAASSEIKLSQQFIDEIQRALLTRLATKISGWRAYLKRITKRPLEFQADLRARISAGEALGILGDPRFALLHGQHGEYLMPPMLKISGGTYPIGNNDSNYDDESPAHQVELDSFQIGQFPVTNAEYAKFMAAGGYDDEQWWDTPDALHWLRKGGAEWQKQSWGQRRKLLKNSLTDDEIRAQENWSDDDKEYYLLIRNESEEEFDERMELRFPKGVLYRQPDYWNDTRFNNPAQPVVGVTWFEARAYCNWFAANTGQLYRLPTEVEFEVAARGKKGRVFPYGNKFDSARGNTFESHIRRTTPVGIFDNATPEGAFDLSGNAYTWTLSIYDQDQFKYPYRSDDGRENLLASDMKRVLRGGSWYDDQGFSRAVYRYYANPGLRYHFIGFRLCCVVRPPSS